jgi:hypothetical protein
MRTITFDLSDKDYEKLQDYAARERRVPDAQAEVFVLQAIHAWPNPTGTKPAAKAKTAAPNPTALVPAANGTGVTTHAQVTHAP